MVKKESENKQAIPGVKEGMVCYKKTGGGSHRFVNRIIKPGQHFWTYPNVIPASAKDLFTEIEPDKGALVLDISAPVVEKAKAVKVPQKIKYTLEKATNEDGEIIMKGDSALYNVVDSNGVPFNVAPIRKKKAEELLDSLTV